MRNLRNRGPERDLFDGLNSVLMNARSGRDEAAYAGALAQVRRARAWGLLPATWGEWFDA